MVVNNRLFLTLSVAEPVTASNPDMKELLFKDKAWEHWESCWGSLRKYFVKFVTNLLYIKKLNLKVNCMIFLSLVMAEQV